MSKLNRRNFIKSTAAAGVAAASTAAPSANAGWFRKTTRSQTKALVIGSGFGGSVATLRLAEAGIQTMLLERGKHWKYEGEGSYPTLAETGSTLKINDTVLWTNPSSLIPGSMGMVEYFVDSSIAVGCGACLGGGSVVYGGVLLQPKREAFEDALPMLSYTDMDQVYYPRVLDRISGGPIPDDVLNHPNYTSKREFIQSAEDAGLEVVRSHVSFDWDVIREELNGTKPRYASVGEYVFGCNSGAKNTLDRNYLVDAEATGNVTINPQHLVTDIHANSGGGYRVTCDMLDEKGKITGKHVIECDYLFMGAGSLHTTRLLLRAKERGDIPGLNDQVGAEWGTNGDELMGRNDINTSTAPIQGGPPSIAAFDTENPYKLTGFMHSPTSAVGEFTQLQMGMVVSDESSRVTYNRWTDKIKLNWDRDANENSHNALVHTMEKMVQTGGGKLNEAGWFGTWHPLGGVAMGSACDLSGKVYGVEGLYVVDGAAIPGGAGAANPALTIAANAERMMEEIIPQIS
ncbi:MAG: GMC oxidoreductase [Pseudomonadota bacterium]|nr:GMC oxidoreductase [Pseudomonadota bacterium]